MIRYDNYLPKNIKTESELSGYNEWLKTDFTKFVKSEYNVQTILGKISLDSIKPIQPVEIKITQADIDTFITEYNNRFKIEYK